MARTIETAEIIAVGSELLTPTRLDTNSLTITAGLGAYGVQVRAKAVVGDSRADLAALLRAALARVDLVVFSGGLGPTEDDLTREVVAAELSRPLHEDPAIVEGLRRRFARRGLVMPEINRRQAQVPEGAVVLPNPNGTAPGLWIEAGAQALLLLPGPPRELKPMLDAALAAHVAPRAPASRRYTRIVRVIGRSESHTEEAARPFYERWAAEGLPIEATILAARGSIELHLTVRAIDEAEGLAMVARAAREVAEAIGDDVYSLDDEPLEVVAGRLLREHGWRLAAAESCTGGLLLARLTDVPGSSAYVDRGVVVYSNASKTALAGVPAPLIEAHGAVSEPVAVAMAEGIRRLSGTEVGVGITGIAGPDGGTPEKPVGTVVVAVCTPDATAARTRRFSGDRDLIRWQSTHAALDVLRRLIEGRRV